MNDTTKSARALPIRMDGDHGASLSTWAGVLDLAGSQAVELREWDGGEVSLTLVGSELAVAAEAAEEATIWFYGARRVELQNGGEAFLAEPDPVRQIAIDATERSDKFVVEIHFGSGASLTMSATHGVARVTMEQPVD